MKAVILAGGKGTRLRPYTTVFPKPLMPIGQRPILDIVVQQLAAHDFRDIIMSVGYLSELIQSYFQHANGRFYRVNIDYVHEKEPLGTAGSLGLVPNLNETFLAMNGDVLSNIDYSDLLAYHRQKQAMLTIAMYSKQVKIDLGVIELGINNLVTGYVEKPTKQYSVSMGIYMYEPQVLDYIQPGEHLDFPELVLRLIENGQRVAGYPFNGYWLDIGRSEDYADAQQCFEENQDLFLPAFLYEGI